MFEAKKRNLFLQEHPFAIKHRGTKRTSCKDLTTRIKNKHRGTKATSCKLLTT